MTQPNQPRGGFFTRMRGGFILKWELLKGGYFAASWLGFRFLQRFHEWGSQAIGTQKEFVARFELAIRPVNTAAWLHLEVFNPEEARIWILNFAVWKGFNLFFTVNLGARLTGLSQSLRAQRMREVMLQKAQKEQRERLKASRFSMQVAKQRNGHPWPTKTR